MRCNPTLVVDRPKEVADWLCERLPEVAWCLRYGFLGVGVERRGKIVAAFVFHSMQNDKGNIELSCAGNGAFATKEVLECLYYSVFSMLGCVHVSCRTSATNTRARKLLERAGFLVEGIQRKAWDGDNDAILYGLIEHDIKR